jgi:hypothetical protein
MKKICIIFFIFVVITMNGCIIRHGEFSVLTDKLVNLKEFELGKAERAKGVEGDDIQHIIFFIPTSGPPNLLNAVDSAMEKGHGDVMTDAVIYQRFFYIPLLYGEAGWEVKGDVVRTRK